MLQQAPIIIAILGVLFAVVVIAFDYWNKKRRKIKEEQLEESPIFSNKQIHTDQDSPVDNPNESLTNTDTVPVDEETNLEQESDKRLEEEQDERTRPIPSLNDAVSEDHQSTEQADESNVEAITSTTEEAALDIKINQPATDLDYLIKRMQALEEANQLIVHTINNREEEKARQNRNEDSYIESLLKRIQELEEENKKQLKQLEKAKGSEIKLTAQLEQIKESSQLLALSQQQHIDYLLERVRNLEKSASKAEQMYSPDS